MKKNNENQPKTNEIGKKEQRKGKPVKVFVITLCSVLTVGILAIVVLQFALRTQGGESQETAAFSEKDEKVHTEKKEEFAPLWESVPEEDEQETEKEPVEETRYGAVLADEAYMKENGILPWESGREDEVTFGFVGDILLDDEYAIMASLLNRGGNIEAGVSEAMLSHLRGVDILVVNNEFPFTDRGTPTEGKTYTFRATPGAVSYLDDLGADVAVLANNHIYDFGQVGLCDTLDTLKEAGLPYVGAGEDLKEASSPLYFIVNDMKIGLVAATQIERLDNPDTKEATEDAPGVFRCWNPERLYEKVREMKENSDFVIVYIHWGTESVAEPDWAQLEQAKGLAQAGADLIIGAHPHCLQGITYCGDTPVVYSLGNFWFNSKTVDTGMLRVSIGQEGIKEIQFVPAVQSDCRVKLAEGEEAQRILTYLGELSPEVAIDAEGYISPR